MVTVKADLGYMMLMYALNDAEQYDIVTAEQACGDNALGRCRGQV